MTSGIDSKLHEKHLPHQLESAERDDVSSALTAEEKIQSSWYVIEPNGDHRLIPIAQFDFNEKNMETCKS